MTPQQEPEKSQDQAPQPIPYLLPPGARDYYRDPRLKSPIIATLLSLMPGLGQVYLGYTRLGFTHGVVACSLIALMSTNRLGSVEPGVGIFMLFFWLYNLVDAHRRALLVNEALVRTESTELPVDFKPMTYRGRITLGVGMTVAGLLGLVFLRYDIPMAWLEMWWPAGFVLLGLYLTVKAVRDRAPKSDSAQD